MKRILAIAVILVTFIAVSYLQAAGVETASTEEPSAVEVGNATCPVNGEEIDIDNKVTYEYEGKIYNFCCQACVDEFKNSPEEYIATLEEESAEE